MNILLHGLIPVLANEPGIYAADGLVKINSIRKFPIMIVNSTNRHINIKKGNMIVKLEAINSVCSFRQTLLQELKGDIDSSEDSVKQPIVPDEYKKPLDKLINEYSDIFSKCSTDIGKTDLLEMLVGWLVVFNVPSTARSFRDGTPIYCPLRRT